jgi:P pilus assembly chaperone PapD
LGAYRFVVIYPSSRHKTAAWVERQEQQAVLANIKSDH